MTAFLLIPLYALADRFAGGGWPALDARLPGRGVFWAALVLAGAGWFLAGPFGAMSALAWFIWRTPAWGVFGGSMAAQTVRETVGILARHLIAVPVLALAAYWSGLDVGIAALLGAAFAALATSFSAALGEGVRRAVAMGEPLGNQNTSLELGRGALFGLAVAVSVSA